MHRAAPEQASRNESPDDSLPGASSNVATPVSAGSYRNRPRRGPKRRAARPSFAGNTVIVSGPWPVSPETHHPGGRRRGRPGGGVHRAPPVRSAPSSVRGAGFRRVVARSRGPSSAAASRSPRTAPAFSPSSTSPRRIATPAAPGVGTGHSPRAAVDGPSAGRTPAPRSIRMASLATSLRLRPPAFPGAAGALPSRPAHATRCDSAGRSKFSSGTERDVGFRLRAPPCATPSDPAPRAFGPPTLPNAASSARGPVRIPAPRVLAAPVLRTDTSGGRSRCRSDCAESIASPRGLRVTGNAGHGVARRRPEDGERLTRVDS